MLPIERHHSAALWYSGGKDSTAALYSLRRFWNKITVLWSNTGDEYPETKELMQRVRSEVPRFLEVNSDVKSNIEKNGWPVDMVPVTHTAAGRQLDGHNKQLMQPFISCCFTNRVAPLLYATKAIGATLIIRGERKGENRRSPVQSGESHNGIEVWLPIYDWTTEQVFDFIRKEKAPLSPGYSLSPTSLDCMTCTGWLASGGYEYLRRHYPAKYAEVSSRLRVIREAYTKELEFVNNTLAGVPIVEVHREIV